MMIMRKTSKLFAALLMVSAALSCSKEISNNTPEEKPSDEPTVTVSFAVSSEDTKTELIDGVDNKKHVSWKEGDKITIFCANGKTTTSVAPEDGTEVVFEAEIPAGGVADEYYAVYPSSAATCQDGAFTVTVPETQYGAFATGNVSVAKLYADGKTTSQFCNVTSFVKVVINDDAYTKVVLTAVGGEKIAGTLPVTLDGDKPVIGEATEGTNVITLNVNQPGTYYIAVNPVVCKKGFSVQYYKGDTKAGGYFLDQQITLGRSKISSLGTLEDRMGAFYVSVEGAGAQTGKNWANAMSAAKFKDFIKIKDSAAERTAYAAMLDGATIYFATGEYDFGTLLYVGFNADMEDYVNITFDGSYSTSTGEKDPSRRTVFTGGESHQIFFLREWVKATFNDCSFVDSKGVESSEAAVKMGDPNSWLIANNCRFENNFNESRGGALAVANGRVELNDCTFSGNTASCGAAFTVDNKDHESPDGGNVIMIGGTISGNNNTDATAGGAICCFGGGPLSVSNVEFTENTSVANGGAFQMIYQPVTTTFTSCTFGGQEGKGNTAKHGGAVAVKDRTATFTDCTFAYNSATGDGGAVLANGSSNLTFNGCTLNNNTCVGLGGCFDIEGGARVTLGKNGSTVSSISSNNAPTGGAFYVKSGSKLTLNECTVNGNKATSKGGVIFATGSSTECNINGGTISGNSAPQGGVAYAETSGKVIVSKNGAAVATISNNTASTNGGAFCISNGGDVTLSECAVNENKATTTGGAIYIDGSSSKLNDNGSSFASNTATSHGGAIMISGAPDATLTGTKFNSNSSSAQGGAISVRNPADATKECVVTLSSCSFDQNSSTADGGAVLAFGKSKVKIDGNSSFTKNHSSAFGGALAATSGSSSTISAFDISGTSEFNGNYSSKDGGAIHIRSTAASSIKGASFIGNNVKNTRCGGGAVLVYKGDVTIEDCYFKGNYTPQSTANDYGGAIMVGDRGTGTSEGGTIIAKINHCFFESNHAFGGGAIALGDTQAKVYANACSFKGDYCKDTNCGTTMYVWAGAELCLNNCTILDGTYQSVLGTTGSSCAWIYVNQANCQTVLSNCSLIGEVRSTDGSTNKIWVNNNAAILHMKSNTKNNHWSINSIITSISEGVRCIYCESAATWTSYYTKRASTSGGTWNSNSSDGYACNGTTNYFGGLNMQSSGTTPDTNYWAWNGTMSNIPSGSKNGKAMLADVKNKINSANSVFYTWLNDIGALDKDQLGNARGATTWPGAYDGTNK